MNSPDNDKLRQAIFRLHELRESLTGRFNPFSEWEETQGDRHAALVLGVHLAIQTLQTMDRTLNYAQQQAAEQKPALTSGQVVYTAVIGRVRVGAGEYIQLINVEKSRTFLSQQAAHQWAKTELALVACKSGDALFADDGISPSEWAYAKVEDWGADKIDYYTLKGEPHVAAWVVASEVE